MAGDHEGFVACFHDAVNIYNEPEVSQRPVINSRAELQGWMARLGERLGTVSIDLVGIAEERNGLVTEAVIVGTGGIPEAGGVGVGVGCGDDLIQKGGALPDPDAPVPSLRKAAPQTG